MGIALAVLLSFSNAVSADAVDYWQTNTDPGTMQFKDSSPSWVGGSLYTLFNDYFQLKGDNKYTSTNQLYNERGVKDIVNSWTINEGAQVYAGFRNANFTHDVYLTNPDGSRAVDANGNSVFSMAFDKSSNVSRLSDYTGMGLDLPVTGEFSWAMDVYYGGTAESVQNGTAGNPRLQWFPGAENSDGLIHLALLDVTDLMQDVFGLDIESAYLFAWEDQTYPSIDFDYQDFAYIMVNVQPNAATPEPATALIFGAALLGLPLARRRFQKKNK